MCPHTVSDFLSQGLGQLLGRCAQETSHLFVTKATTTSHWPLHLIEMHIWYLKKKTTQFFAPGSGGPVVLGIGMFAGKIGHQEYSTEKGSPEVNEPNTTGNLHLSRDKQRCWHSLHYDSNENTHVGSQAEGSYAWGMHHQKQNNLEVLWKKDG